MSQSAELDPAMAPLVIMFVRHGEKPGEDGPPHGINDQGSHDPHALSVRGWTRAGGLAGLFGHAPNPAHPQVVVPQRIIATKPSQEAKSRREYDTAEPLAHRLGLDIDDDFEHGHEHRLQGDILNDPRDTLVVWHHGGMSHLVRGLPIRNLDDVPVQWPDDRFDLIWILSRQAGDSDYAFVQSTQRLLGGDEGVQR